MKYFSCLIFSFNVNALKDTFPLRHKSFWYITYKHFNSCQVSLLASWKSFGETINISKYFPTEHWAEHKFRGKNICVEEVVELEVISLFLKSNFINHKSKGIRWQRSKFSRAKRCWKVTKSELFNKKSSS